MSSPGTNVPTPSGEQPIPHRRKRRRKKSRIGWVLLGVCVLGGLAVPLLREAVPKYKPGASTLQLAPRQTSRLSLGEARFQGEGPQRFIEGTVKNTSPQRVKNVVVTLNLHVNSDSVAGLAVGKIAAIEPNGSASFRTDPVPLNVRRFFVRDIAVDSE